MSKKVKVWEGFWTPEDCKDNPNCSFIFGDNLVGQGKGGQAVIRDEPNAVGLPTKILPSMTKKSFFKDENDAHLHLGYYLGRIEHDITVGEIYRKTDTIIFSANGYGNGLSKLDKMYPKVYEYLCDRIKIMIKYFGGKEELDKVKF